ncbi:iron chelate uptake ABC transporter family permease subunit [Curtobacterium sp. MCJR17_043]|uniref:iron chelate uptake ABC transporter family permease subunit n=1 Tax=Curtobacterium sp. MCJR17_043 TaxID=2175660 RepID=UPI0024DFF360|nr:iron chelate uptake ABC transporter family permease subunit [Curtobacterium sp. MCJR17_043]WIB34824.1 iron chelate uptake ABC transporter family permease subunit [Curtobacterium sp. MCJR17_043]
MTPTALRGALVVPVLAVALVGVVIAGVTLAGGSITWAETVRSIGTHLGLPLTPLPPLADSVVWQLRLPRVLLAAAAGAGLAVCGCVLQAVTRNVLAEPYLLGISSGASTGGGPRPRPRPRRRVRHPRRGERWSAASSRSRSSSRSWGGTPRARVVSC